MICGRFVLLRFSAALRSSRSEAASLGAQGCDFCLGLVYLFSDFFQATISASCDDCGSSSSINDPHAKAVEIPQNTTDPLTVWKENHNSISDNADDLPELPKSRSFGKKDQPILPFAPFFILHRHWKRREVIFKSRTSQLLLLLVVWALEVSFVLEKLLCSVFLGNGWRGDCDWERLNGWQSC